MQFSGKQKDSYNQLPFKVDLLTIILLRYNV